MNEQQSKSPSKCARKRHGSMDQRLNRARNSANRSAIWFMESSEAICHLRGSARGTHSKLLLLDDDLSTDDHVNVSRPRSEWRNVVARTPARPPATVGSDIVLGAKQLHTLLYYGGQPRGFVSTTQFPSRPPRLSSKRRSPRASIEWGGP